MEHFNFMSEGLGLLKLLLQVSKEGREIRLIPKVLIDAVNGVIAPDRVKEVDFQRCKVLHEYGLHLFPQQLLNVLQGLVLVPVQLLNAVADAIIPLLQVVVQQSVLLWLELL